MAEFLFTNAWLSCILFWTTTLALTLGVMLSLEQIIKSAMPSTARVVTMASVIVLWGICLVPTVKLFYDNDIATTKCREAGYQYAAPLLTGWECRSEMRMEMIEEGWR